MKNVFEKDDVNYFEFIWKKYLAQKKVKLSKDQMVLLNEINVIIENIDWEEWLSCLGQ